MGPCGSGKIDAACTSWAASTAPTPASTARGRRAWPRLGDERAVAAAQPAIGFVFQSFHLIPQLTGAENVETAAALRGRAARASGGRGRCARSSAWASAPRATTARPSSRAASSSAWRSRARSSPSRACCWPTSPPATSTPATGEEIRALLEELTRAGRTVVLVTHNEALGRGAERVVRLRDGRVESEERRHEPRARRAAAARGAQPAAAQAALEPVDPRASSSASRRSSRVAVGEGARREAVAQIAASGSTRSR